MRWRGLKPPWGSSDTDPDHTPLAAGFALGRRKPQGVSAMGRPRGNLSAIPLHQGSPCGAGL